MSISPPPTSSAELGRMAELAEAEAMHSLVSGAGPAARAEHGIALTRRGGGVVVSTLRDSSGFWTPL